jgi:protein-tyrosine phosphatase
VLRAVYGKQIYLGNAVDARDLRLLYANEIAAVVDLAANEPPAQLGRDLIYCRIPLVDGGENSDALLDMVIGTTRLLLRQKFRTLVACSAGMSRSPAIAAAIISLETGAPAEECLARIATMGPHDVAPDLWASVLCSMERN